jgi:pimeloyl-ACP methyl ester carboxylesterase
MRAATAIIMWLLVLPGATAKADSPAFSPERFSRWFRLATVGRLEIPDEVAGCASGFRYVFIGGFGGEALPGYFDQNRRELRAWGVPRGAIHQIHPSSRATTGGNAGAVRAAIEEAASEGPEPLVIIAHSRGACDALAFALDNPDFVRKRVHAIFLVQGAFGGSAAADYVTGQGTPMDGQMSPVLRLLAFLIARAERFLVARGPHAGLHGMTRDASRAYWDRMLADHADALPVVGPKTFYVTSATRPGRLGPFRKAVAHYLGTYYGRNDGVVELNDQSLPGLGTTLAVLDASHADLTQKFPAGRGGRRLRRALVQSILMAVGADASPIRR